MHEIAEGPLRLLWSEVEWPFESAALQRNAVEFHGVVTHMFSQGAVAPFRLLSVFDDQRSLTAFVGAYHTHFVADLERLADFVQMESVIYVGREAAASGISGKAYLELKAELLRGVEGYIQRLREALDPISHGIRVRESKNGNRMFVLVERGKEASFHSLAQSVSVPERLSRRMSGPWPASEFLSEAVRMPQGASKG